MYLWTTAIILAAMRVLMVYDAVSPHAGGALETTLRWTRNLLSSGVEVKLLCDQNILRINTNLPDDTFIINHSLPFHPGGTDFGLQLILYPSTKKKILQFQPDIIHLHEQLFISPQVLSFAKANKIPTLYSLHGNASELKSHRFPQSLLLKKNSSINKMLEAAQFHLLRQAPFITAPTRHFQHLVEKKTERQAYFIPYAVSDHFFRSPSGVFPDQVTKLLAVSRLSGEKNIHILIEMMAYLSEKFSLTIIGEGPDRGFLERRAAELGVLKSVYFTGWVRNNELPTLLQDHHVFLSPSDFETFGITYIEALASGLPCVVYDYPISREVIPHGTAFFIPSLEPKRWASAIQQLNKRPQRYWAMKSKITQRQADIQRYEEHHSTKKLIETYEDVLFASNVL